MSRHPPVKWAQRSNELYITTELPDAQDVTLILEPEGKFHFSATAGAEKFPYKVGMDLFDKVDVNIVKAGRKTSTVFFEVDWDKWVDEDEEQEDNKPGADMDFGDFDFSRLNMGGSEGLDYEDDDESDIEDEDIGQALADNEPDTKDTMGGNPGVASDVKT